MDTQKIDDQIRDYYAAQRPSADAVVRLKQLIAAGAPAARPSRLKWMSAAAALLVIAGALVWSGGRRIFQSPQRLAAEVARQAAQGHNKKQELEFRVHECAELRARMKSLDFAPVEPAMMRDMKMHVVGARYTTLAGEIAAQIVYVDANGVPCTLYEARPVDRLARLAPGEHEIDGLHIDVWKEKGLVMVLARPMA